LGRAAWAGLGLASPIATLIGIGWILGHNLIAENIPYTAGVVGDFHIGYRIIVRYLWAAEGGTALLWVAGAAAAVGFRRGEPRLKWYLGGAVAVLAGLILLSDVIPMLKVQGRLIRTAAIPFLVLGAACGIDAVASRISRGWGASIAVGAGILAVASFSGPLRQWFPRGFRIAAESKADQLRRVQPGNYRILNACFLFGPEVAVSPPFPGRTVWRASHPDQYLPFLFEGFTEEYRAGFLARDCAMRLVRMGSAGNFAWLGGRPELARHGGFPGAVAMRVRFRTEAVGKSEQLVVTGETGKGDFLYVVYQDTAHVRFGIDHWGLGGAVSPVIGLDYSQPHELVLSMGSMFPPGYPGTAAHHLFLSIDGHVVFDSEQYFNPCDAGSVMFGFNLIGGGSARDRFTGAIERVDPCPRW
jgi:hypothetical protein